MTDRCAPPDGSPSGYYWIEHDNMPVPMLWEWLSGLRIWKLPYRNTAEIAHTPSAMDETGYRYLGPCRPDDAEVRERVEAENKRLREALEAIAHHKLVCSTDPMPIAMQEVALAALTPGDAS